MEVRTTGLAINTFRVPSPPAIPTPITATVKSSPVFDHETNINSVEQAQTFTPDGDLSINDDNRSSEYCDGGIVGLTPLPGSPPKLLPPMYSMSRTHHPGGEVYHYHPTFPEPGKRESHLPSAGSPLAPKKSTGSNLNLSPHERVSSGLRPRSPKSPFKKTSNTIGRSNGSRPSNPTLQTKFHGKHGYPHVLTPGTPYTAQTRGSARTAGSSAYTPSPCQNKSILQNFWAATTNNRLAFPGTPVSFKNDKRKSATSLYSASSFAPSTGRELRLCGILLVKNLLYITMVLATIQFFLELAFATVLMVDPAWYIRDGGSETVPQSVEEEVKTFTLEAGHDEGEDVFLECIRNHRAFFIVDMLWICISIAFQVIGFLSLWRRQVTGLLSYLLWLCANAGWGILVPVTLFAHEEGFVPPAYTIVGLFTAIPYILVSFAMLRYVKSLKSRIDNRRQVHEGRTNSRKGRLSPGQYSAQSGKTLTSADKFWC